MRWLSILCSLCLMAGCGTDAPHDADGDSPPDAGEPSGDGDGDGDGDADDDDDENIAMDAGPESDASTGDVDAGPPLSRTPRRMLLADEGSAALHHVDLDDPSQNWSYQVADGDPCCNRLRDLQLIGDDRVMISVPSGYVELDLNERGNPLRTVTLTGVPGGIEAARRLPDGHTVVAGNGGGGIFVYEFDENDELIGEHKRLFTGLAYLRGLRLTEQGTFLFTSDTDAGKRVYEGGWTGDAQLLFDVPGDVGARHMTKAMRTGPSEVTVSTGYGASLIRIDTQNKQVTKLIGGPDVARPEGADRDVDSHFYAGFLLRPNGDYVVANWIDHGAGHNGQGYQLLQFDHDGNLIWVLDQTQFPAISSLHNVLVLDGLDTAKLHDDRGGVLVPL